MNLFCAYTYAHKSLLISSYIVGPLYFNFQLKFFTSVLMYLALNMKLMQDIGISFYSISFPCYNDLPGITIDGKHLILYKENNE